MAPRSLPRRRRAQTLRDAASLRLTLFAFDTAAADDTALRAEYDRIRTRGQELAAIPAAELTAEQSSELLELSNNSTAVVAELDAREARAAELAAASAAFAALPERPMVVAEPVTPPAPEAPVAPVAAPVTAVEPAGAPAPVAVPSVADMAAQPPAVPVVPAPTETIEMQFSSDGAAVLGRSVGERASVLDVTNASLRLFQQFGQGSPSRGSGQKASRALGAVRRTRDAGLQMPASRNQDESAAVLKFARDQKRLEGGSLLTAWSNSAKRAMEDPARAAGALTAAAGWCAPSENRYDLCQLWDVDGLFDAPTTTAPRGGINYTSDVTWAQINDAAITSFTSLTEAQVIAGTPKSCTELPCPDFTDRRMDVAVTCITGSFLQSFGYPEVVSTWTDGLLTRHEYEVNRLILAQVIAQAGAAVVIPGQNDDTSAAASLLAAVEIAAIDMRERSNMRFDAVLEVVLPRWVLAQLRADISRRISWYADPMAVANQQIINWFVMRGIRPQFIRGWQDAQSGLAGGPGDINEPIVPITALPSTVNFLIYPAGAVVIMREDIVTLTNVYDSTNLSQNLYTALFTEEGFAPIFPCGEIRQYTANVCPSGATATTVDTSCVVTP